MLQLIGKHGHKLKLPVLQGTKADELQGSDAVEDVDEHPERRKGSWLQGGEHSSSSRTRGKQHT